MSEPRLMDVLQASVLKLGAATIGAAAAATALFLDTPAVVGVVAGGALALGSGWALISLVGRILGASGAGGAALLLGLKLVVVLGFAWLGLTLVDPLGFVLGLGAGILGFVLGAQFGQSSEAGRAAIAAEEARAAQQSRDSEAETR